MRTTLLFLIVIAGLTFSQRSSAQITNYCYLNTSFSYDDSTNCMVVFYPDTVYTSYFWHFGDGNTSQSQTPHHYYNTPGNYTVKLFVSNGICGDSVVQVVSVTSCNPPCNLDAGFIYMDSSQCETSFTPNNYNPYHTYIWDFGDGNTSNSVGPYHVYNSPGSYNVTLIVSNDTCADTITQTVIVPPCNPPCNLDAGFIYMDSSQCETSFTPNNYNPYHTYLWDFGDGNTSNSDGPYHVYNSPGSYNVTLIVSNDTCADTITQTVIVPPCNPPCNLDAGFTYYDSACYTGFVPLANDSTLNYYWDFGDGTSSTNYNPEHLYITAGTYYVILYVSNGICTDTLQQSVQVSVCTSPCPIDASFSHVNTSGNTYDFSPNTFNAIYNYHWIFGDGTVSTDAYPTHTFANEEDYFVTLVVSDCNCSASETIVLNVADSSACNYNGEFTYTLENDGSYTFTPMHQSSNYEYYWSFGDGSSSTEMVTNYTYLSNSNYLVSLGIWEPGNSLCSDTVEKFIHVSSASNCLLNSSFTMSSDTSNNIVHFYPNIYNSNYSYEWNFGDGQFSNFHSPNHSYSTNGTFAVTLNVYFDSCHSSDTINIEILTANLIQLPGSNYDVNIYPNPATDYLHIDFTGLHRDEIQILLSDANGRLIKRDAFTVFEGENHKQINVQSISKGMYQIVLQKEDGTFIQRTRFIKN